MPDRKIVIVADSSFAALDLIAAVRRHVCLVTRLLSDGVSPNCSRYLTASVYAAMWAYRI
jgi:hypothetical protein